MSEPRAGGGQDETLAERVHVDLPRVRPEDMVTSQEVEPPPDPTGGRDVDTEFLVRHIAL